MPLPFFCVYKHTDTASRFIQLSWLIKRKTSQKRGREGIILRFKNLHTIPCTPYSIYNLSRISLSSQKKLAFFCFYNKEYDVKFTLICLHILKQVCDNYTQSIFRTTKQHHSQYYSIVYFVVVCLCTYTYLAYRRFSCG